MSSRALRKLHGGVNADLLGPGDGPVADDADSQEEELTMSLRSKRNKSKTDAVANPFDLLEEEDGLIQSDEDKVDDSEKITNDIKPAKEKSSKKKKKKKKKKSQSDGKLEQNSEITNVEEDIDASIREVNQLLGEIHLPTDNGAFRSDDHVTMAMKALLTVEHKHLVPENEMKRMFGSRVVQGEQNRRRGHGRMPVRATKLVRPKENWPAMPKIGLSMTLIDTVRGNCYFTFEHNKQYQKVTFDFLDAVESLEPQNIINLTHIYPGHVASLLQVSDICRMSDDTQMAADFIERALYNCESCFHPRFSLTQGNCRLDYRRPENRSFYLALFRHAIFVGLKGCNRTALELCKLILSLDPEGDPLCVLLMMDFYALRSEEHGLLVRLCQEWEDHRNLSQLPNMAFSLALAMYHIAVKENTETTNADARLQDALLKFPSLLLPMLDKCGIEADGAVVKHPFLAASSHIKEPASLQQLIGLYVGRCHVCWKPPDVAAWLETNVRAVMGRVDQGEPLAKQYSDRRKQLYKGTPRNIYRHIVISEIKEATASLPPEVTGQAVLSYDPLPPTDSIISYTRPQRPRAAQQDSSPLSMFFRSLLPNFNPQEPVAEEGAMGGEGHDLRQGVAALMDTMRELLNNIQPATPPREDGNNDEDVEEFD